VIVLIENVNLEVFESKNKMDLGEFPEVDVEYAWEPMDGSLEFFLSYETLCGMYNVDGNIISIYSLCSNVTKDLPYIEDVVLTMEHETMHWILTEFISYWASICYDNIGRDLDSWIEDEWSL
jgi:hypothetical protein